MSAAPDFPVADYAEPTLTECLDSTIAAHRRHVRLTAALCLSIGFMAGMAAVAVPLILGVS